MGEWAKLLDLHWRWGDGRRVNRVRERLLWASRGWMVWEMVMGWGGSGIAWKDESVLLESGGSLVLVRGLSQDLDRCP